MAGSTKKDYTGEFVKNRLVFLIFAFVAVLVPLFALFIPMKPESVSSGEWFARSGAAMVILALLAETQAIAVYNLCNPSGIVANSFIPFKKKYGHWVGKLNTLALVLIAVGTFIWGDGDLFF